MPLSFSRIATLAVVAVGLLSKGVLANGGGPINTSFDYDHQKVRGVNLGGWLVLEPWITPSLFDGTGDDRIVDEWTFGQYQDRNQATRKLRNHWDTWITEDDFAVIRNAGLNHVRIPIGYWAFEVNSGEPYITGQLPYLQKAIVWARNHNLKVIVDLHGAPGSQNGFDNSGQRMSYPQWHTSSANTDRTNDILGMIAEHFAHDDDVVTIIAPLNEPAGFYGEDVMRAVRKYWDDSYNIVRQQHSNQLVLVHDAFQPLSSWSGTYSPPNYQGVVMDTHIYQMFSQDEVSRSYDQHIQVACSKGDSLASFRPKVIVGEWTPAPTDCAKYLNGRGIGARYDGTYPGSTKVGNCWDKTGNRAGFSADYQEFLRKYWEAQVITFEKGAGWVQWTWKAEQADDWSYQAGLYGGWIPWDPTDLKYRGICG